MSKPITIPATVQLSPADLAALIPTNAKGDILERVEKLLIDVRERLAVANKMLLSASEVADRFGVCARSITGAAGRGEIEATRIGSRVLFTPEACAEFIRKNTTPAKT